MRIGANSGGNLAALHDLVRANNQLDLSQVRLATMQRINSASDDPAGLIMAEQIRAELTAINAATDNAARAGSVVRTADSALGQVSELLNDVRGNLVAGASGGRSDAERAAIQLENDAALDAINLIGHTTSFGGEPLLDGSELSFALSPDVSNVATVSLPSVSTADLGGPAGTLTDLAHGGSNSLGNGNPATAMAIIDAASNQVLNARAELGAFEKFTIGATVSVLEGMQVNLSFAFSQVFDADVAQETSRAARAQILAEGSMLSMLSAQHNRKQISSLFTA